MPNDITRVDYEQLKQIAARFERESQSSQQMLQALRGMVEQLRGGDWIGQGATAFYGEMESAVLPSLGRLVKALHSASVAAQKISAEVKRAEEEAAKLLRGDDAPAKKGGFWSGVWNGLKDAAGGLWSGVKQVGGFFAGFAEQGWDTITGLWKIVSDPIGTAKGLWYGITHPGEMFDAIVKPFVDDWQSGNYGKAIGRGAFELLGLFAGGAGVVGKGGKVASIADKASDVARVADKASDIARTADKATDVARGTDKASDAAGAADKASDAARAADKAADIAPAGKGAVIDSAFENLDVAKRLKKVDGVSIKPIEQAQLDELGALRTQHGVKPNQNIADATVDLNTTTSKTTYQAHSGYDRGKSSIPDGSPSPGEARIFETGDAPAASGKMLPRHNDAEAKMLEQIASDLGARPGDLGSKVFTDVRGTIKIRSELSPCGSCAGVIEQFKQMFPNVDFEILAQPKASF